MKMPMTFLTPLYKAKFCGASHGLWHGPYGPPIGCPEDSYYTGYFWIPLLIGLKSATFNWLLVLNQHLVDGAPFAPLKNGCQLPESGSCAVYYKFCSFSQQSKNPVKHYSRKFVLIIGKKRVLANLFSFMFSACV